LFSFVEKRLLPIVPEVNSTPDNHFHCSGNYCTAVSWYTDRWLLHLVKWGVDWLDAQAVCTGQHINGSHTS